MLDEGTEVSADLDPTCHECTLGSLGALGDGPGRGEVLAEADGGLRRRAGHHRHLPVIDRNVVRAIERRPVGGRSPRYSLLHHEQQRGGALGQTGVGLGCLIERSQPVGRQKRQHVGHATVGRVPDVPAIDEARHEAGPEDLWAESWYLDFFDPEAGVGGYVRLGLYPNQGVAWYWACLVGPGRPLVTVIDHDIKVPERSLEIRTEGLWSNYTVETPLDHVSVGVEAFALSVGDPADVYGDLRGDRVPFGLDLEWETDGSVYPYPDVDRYEVPCRVHGEVLLADETLAIDGWGQRDHSWGVRDWWSYAWSWTAGRLDDGTRFHGTSVDIDGVPLYGTGYLQAPGGPQVGTDQVARSEIVRASGLPTSAKWQIDDLELVVIPIAFSPVMIAATDGRVSRFPRAWCRFTASDGRQGQGWTEWNQPGA